MNPINHQTEAQIYKSWSENANNPDNGRYYFLNRKETTTKEVKFDKLIEILVLCIGIGAYVAFFMFLAEFSLTK